jgi:hypothetical protein
MHPPFLPLLSLLLIFFGFEKASSQEVETCQPTKVLAAFAEIKLFFYHPFSALQFIYYKSNQQMHTLLLKSQYYYIPALGKTTTLLFFLDSLFPKTEIYVCEMLPLETKWSGDKLLPHSDLRGRGGVFLGEISSSKHYSKKEKARFGRGLGTVVRQNTDE